jgi:hypothetical protein
MPPLKDNPETRTRSISNKKQTKRERGSRTRRKNKGRSVAGVKRKRAHLTLNPDGSLAKTFNNNIVIIKHNIIIFGFLCSK